MTATPRTAGSKERSTRRGPGGRLGGARRGRNAGRMSTSAVPGWARGEVEANSVLTGAARCPRTAGEGKHKRFVTEKAKERRCARSDIRRDAKGLSAKDSGERKARGKRERGGEEQ